MSQERTHGPARESPARTHVPRRAESPSGDRPTHPALQLQRSAGNAAVATALSVQRKDYKSISGEIKGPLSKDKEGVSTFNFSEGWLHLPD